MNIVKKWLSCIISFVAGVLGLALSACSGMIVNINIDASAVNNAMNNSSTETTKAFEVITDGDLFTQAKDLGIETQFIWLKVFAIITLIVSILLIIYSIISLLQNLNVIKSNHIAFDIVGVSLAVLMLVATIGLMICSNVYASALESALTTSLTSTYQTMTSPEIVSLIKFDIVAKTGVYQPIMLTVGIVLTIIASVYTILKRKSI